MTQHTGSIHSIDNHHMNLHWVMCEYQCLSVSFRNGQHNLSAIHKLKVSWKNLSGVERLYENMRIKQGIPLLLWNPWQSLVNLLQTPKPFKKRHWMKTYLHNSWDQMNTNCLTTSMYLHVWTSCLFNITLHTGSRHNFLIFPLFFHKCACTDRFFCRLKICMQTRLVCKFRPWSSGPQQYGAGGKTTPQLERLTRP